MRRILMVILLFLLFLFVGGALARSQHPFPSHGKNESRIPQTNAENGQQPPTADQRGTEQSPVIVKIIGTGPKTQNSTGDNPDKAKTKPPADWWSVAIGGGTLFVLGLQLIAFTAQACYMRRTVTKMQSTTSAAIRAAKAAEDTIGHMRETAERQLRAYLSIESAISEGEHPFLQEFKAKISFKNCGQTPAYDGAMWMSIYAYPQVFPTILALKRTIITFEMPPGNTVTVCPAIETKNLLFTTEAISRFEAGKVAIYITGRADFKDAFRQKRRFSFRLRYDNRCFATRLLNIQKIKSN